MIEGLRLSIPQRLSLIRTTIILSLVTSFFLSFKLWFGYHTFPAVNLLSLPMPSEGFVNTLMVLACILVISSMIFRKGRFFIFFYLVVIVYIALIDINRVQPWFYFYNAMLFVLLFYNGRVDDSNKFTSYFILLQIIVASVYFFSGIAKLGDAFVHEEFATLISPLRNVLSDRQFALFVKTGYAVPYLLITMGIALTIPGIRYLAIALSAIIHSLLLVFLFPSSAHQNYSLWFMNLPFLVIVFLLFSGKTKQRYFSPTVLFQVPAFYLVVPAFVIMPFFNPFGKWPDYLSSNFNGNNNQPEFILGGKTYLRLPPYLKAFCRPTGDGLVLDHRSWALHDIKVESFPHELTLRAIREHLSRFDAGDVKERESRPDVR